MAKMLKRQIIKRNFLTFSSGIYYECLAAATPLIEKVEDKQLNEVYLLFLQNDL